MASRVRLSGLRSSTMRPIAERCVRRRADGAARLGGGLRRRRCRGVAIGDGSGVAGGGELGGDLGFEVVGVLVEALLLNRGWVETRVNSEP